MTDALIIEGLLQATDFGARYRESLALALNSLDMDAVGKAAAMLQKARDEERMIFVCGNGGSAATASHFACDIGKGASYGRESRFRIVALTDSIPNLTAYSNDLAYDAVFVEPLKNLARGGDLVIAISGSGNSPNVIRAMEYAGSIGCATLALTGRDGGRLGPLAQVEIRVSDAHMGRIEDGHMVVCHMISYFFMEQ